MELYKCEICGAIFDDPIVRYEPNSDGEHHWQERYEFCPICGEGYFRPYDDEDEE